MMKTLVLSSTWVHPRRPNSHFSRPSIKRSIDGSSLKRKKRNMVWCQSSSGNVRTSNVSPSFLSERSMAATDCSKGLMDNGSVVLLPDAKVGEGIGNKELVPCGGTASTMVELHEGIGIVSFLKGKGFLITGATGFLAKVLIEKILRTVPDVSRIFLLIKAKSKEAAVERLKNEIINAELFKCLQETHGTSYQSFMLSKLVPVVGNVIEDDLGIETELSNKIAGEIDIIINSAANTTFDERYDVALDINTRGPCRLMNFARRCKKLNLFLHVSTAYVNGQRQGRILEKPFLLGDNIAWERMDSNSLSNSFPQLDVQAEFNLTWDLKEASQPDSVAQKMKEIGLERARTFGWHDTYAFTKAMGEMLVDDGRGEIPVVIVRPSIIESTWKEPFPGWIEGNRMLDPIILYYGKGQLTSFVADPSGILDVVPADMVVNATLAAIAKHGLAGKPGMNTYHIASSVANPLVTQDLSRIIFEYFKSFPYMDSKGRRIDVPQMKLFHSIDDFSMHVWSHIIQQRRQAAAFHGKLSQNSRQLEDICKKALEQAKYLASIYKPYTFYRGRFDNTNTHKLMEDMSEEEKRIFGFDVGSIDWKDYISNIHIPGLRRHVMKGRGN